MSTLNDQPGQVASIGFFNADHKIYQTEKPYVCLVPLTHAPPDFKQTNIEMVRHQVLVRNIRGFEDHINLDSHGFQLVKHNPNFDNWYDGPDVVRTYYPYVTEFLKDKLGAARVFIYDHSLRLGDHVEGGSRNKDVQGRPAVLAHVDNSLASAVLQIHTDFKEDAEHFMKKRFQIVNFWHPILEPVMQQPIAFCDYQTAKNDAFPADLVYPHLLNENMLVRHSPKQKWYFIDEQRMNEAWLIKIADSSDDPSVSKYCPHTSFTVDWRDDQGVPPRQSIEFRAYVFYT